MVHLGHNRSVADIVRAAIQEDATGSRSAPTRAATSSTSRYVVDMLRERGAEPHPRVRRRRRHDHAGGDRRARGVWRRADLPPERRHDARADRHDRRLVERAECSGRVPAPRARSPTDAARRPRRSRACSRRSRTGRSTTPALERLRRGWRAPPGTAPVVGITGTGGAGKSTVTDELLSRFVPAFPGVADRGGRGRSDPPADRRRAARRSDPHEQPAQRAHLHALDGDAAAQPLDERDARTTRSRSCAAPGSTW